MLKQFFSQGIFHFLLLYRTLKKQPIFFFNLLNNNFSYTHFFFLQKFSYSDLNVTDAFFSFSSSEIFWYLSLLFFTFFLVYLQNNFNIFHMFLDIYDIYYHFYAYKEKEILKKCLLIFIYRQKMDKNYFPQFLYIQEKS